MATNNPRGAQSPSLSLRDAREQLRALFDGEASLNDDSKRTLLQALGLSAPQSLHDALDQNGYFTNPPQITELNNTLQGRLNAPELAARAMALIEDINARSHDLYGTNVFPSFPEPRTPLSGQNQQVRAANNSRNPRPQVAMNPGAFPKQPQYPQRPQYHVPQPLPPVPMAQGPQFMPHQMQPHMRVPQNLPYQQPYGYSYFQQLPQQGFSPFPPGQPQPQPQPQPYVPAVAVPADEYDSDNDDVLTHPGIDKIKSFPQGFERPMNNCDASRNLRNALQETLNDLPTFIERETFRSKGIRNRIVVELKRIADSYKDTGVINPYRVRDCLAPPENRAYVYTVQAYYPLGKVRKVKFSVTIESDGETAWFEVPMEEQNRQGLTGYMPDKLRFTSWENLEEAFQLTRDDHTD